MWAINNCGHRAVSSSCMVQARIPTKIPTSKINDSSSVHKIQIRYLWHDPRIKKKSEGLPLISRSNFLLVSRDIPVVLKQDVIGVGKKGQIVNTKRGFARNSLIPQGLAAYATVWENVDRYADPTLVDDMDGAARQAELLKAHRFDWIKDIKLQFIRDTDTTQEEDENLIIKPIGIWEIIDQLRQNYQLDLIPRDFVLPEGGLIRLGMYQIRLELKFLHGTVIKKINVPLEIKSTVVFEEEQRTEELKALQNEKPSFNLGRSSVAMDAAARRAAEEVDEDDE